MHISPLPYTVDSAAYFAAIADLPWAIWLDSGGRGRYDILCAQPVATLVTHGSSTTVTDSSGSKFLADDPFELLRQQLGKPTANSPDIPFSGGALGYWGYDLSRRLMTLPTQAQDDKPLPDMAVGIYDWAIVLDHQLHTAQLVSQQRHPATTQALPEILKRLQYHTNKSRSEFNPENPLENSTPILPPTPPLKVGEPDFHPPIQGEGWGGDGLNTTIEQSEFKVHGRIVSNFTRAEYQSAFEKVQRFLSAGDCYQVNLAQRHTVVATGDALQAYLTLRHISPAPYSVFLNLPQVQILCASPECFLRVRDGLVETKPIKGTRPRLDNALQDAQMVNELHHSAKDRAENLMIVDLLRNDLGKNCLPGSIQVPKLFEVESFTHVHHLVSTITGQLAPGRDALALLRDCFPGGSITGAPKQRAMEIIERIEPHRRGIYCGVIGYVGYDGNMDSNIVIRTLVYANNEISFATGGGIVADSDAAAEYQETLDKGKALMYLLRQYGGE